jgi:multidrug efflux pump subunit AcrA (membrane-fusion protein)
MSVIPTSRQTPSSRGTQSDSPRRTRRRRGGIGLKSLVAVCLAGGAWAAYGGLRTTTPTDAYRDALTVPVHRGNLLITVIEDGNLESSKNLDIKCQVPGSQTILEIVLDGSEVHKGDLLVRLDSSLLEDEILAQEIIQGKAEAAKISAEKSFAAASIAVEEYREGTFVQELETLQVAATVAKQNVASMENLLFYSKKMLRNGYVTHLEVESKEFAVEQARLNLGVAELKTNVLQKFTRAKMLEDLTSKRDSAEALMKSAQATEQQEANKLRRLKENLDKCIIRATQDGMVVYANDMTSSRRGGSGQEAPKVELGAQVRQYQSLLRMPDLKHMRVKTLVHESKVDQLRLGQRARIKVLDREFQGEVISIANQPEAANRMSNGVKEYATVVALDGEPIGLRPGMTADVEILVEEKKDVLALPLQCVVEMRKKRRAWVKTPTGVEMRELLLGATDDVSVEVVDGVKEGELVLLNPTAVMGWAETEEEEETSEAAQPSGPRDAAATGPGVPPDGNRGSRRERGETGTRPEGAGRYEGAGGRPDGGRPDGAPPREAGGGQEGRGAAGGRRGGRRLNFKELDKNGDGKVSLDEMPEDRRERFGRMDANSDGFIDQDEQKAMEERMRQAQEQSGRGGGPPGGQ